MIVTAFTFESGIVIGVCCLQQDQCIPVKTFRYAAQIYEVLMKANATDLLLCF